MAEGNPEELWVCYSNLYQRINCHLTTSDPTQASTNEFENLLRRNKSCFISLLQNLPKNTKSREDLKKGMDEGITVKGMANQVLSRDLYQEAIILSDMFDLNEYVALDLLCTAQMRMPNYPDLPRGLVAVTLYYASRKYLVSTLRNLIQGRKGVSWKINIPKHTQTFVTAYMNQLCENGLFERIFDLMKSLDLSKEMEKLQANLALGGPRHRKQVTENFNDTKMILAECIFLWATQTGLTKQVTLSLLQYLREVKLEQEASGKLDNVTLFLLMAFLSAVDLSILHTREDGEECVKQLPVLSEDDFIMAILNELSPSKQKWNCEGLQAVALFGFAVCLSSLRLVPQGQQLQAAIDQEDEFIDAAIIMKVFEFMTNIMMENELFYIEELIYKRMHYLICDFIVQMYPKVKELRIKADETARTIQAYYHEGLELPSNLARYFENLLMVVSKLYSKDPLNLQLMLDYWSPSDTSHHRAHPRSVSLFKFVRLAGDMLPPSLFVKYLMMLTSLSGCQQAARNCFNMLKQPSGFNNNITWDHFFMSFNQYYSNLKQEMPAGQEVVYRHSRVYHKGITPQEVEGLHAVLMIIKAVAAHDEFSRLALCEHPGWAPLNILLGLISCSVPMTLKSDLLHALSSLCSSSETAMQMWNNLETAQILVTVPTTSSYQPRGIQTELEEVESRLEEYPLTCAWLTLMDVLTDSGIPRTLGSGLRQPGFDPYFTFIVNSVFLKFNTRPYKNNVEKWQVAALCLKLFAKFLVAYEPDTSDFPAINKQNEFNSPPGYHLMLQLHTNSELFNGLLFVINEGNRLFDMCLSFPGDSYIDQATLYALQIIERCLQLQLKFFHLLSTSNCPPALTKMNKLLLIINPRSGKPDHVLNILKYLCYQEMVPQQSFISVKILQLLTMSPITHSQIMNILLSSTENKTVRTGFVQCLDRCVDPDNEIISNTKKEILYLVHQCLPYNAPNLTHYLFGFDIKRQVSKTFFQLAGVLNFPKTCIHSLVGILRSNIYKNIENDPSLLEVAYQMLYALCSNPKTAEPVLRLLRIHPNFFRDHVIYCHKNYNQGISNLNQFSWILKTLAIELRLACAGKQIANLKQLTKLLIGIPVEYKPQDDMYSIIPRRGEPTIEDVYMDAEQLRPDNFLIKLITDFEFNIEEVIAPQWGFFENNSLESYLENCQTNSTPKLIDIKRLHRNLIEEVTAAQGSTALGQRQAMMEEIQKVLLHALNINNNRRTSDSISQFVDAWRQITEVLIMYIPVEVIPAKEQVLLEIYLLENVLRKCVKGVLLPEVAGYLSGAVALLLENLRKSHLNEEKFTKTIMKEQGKKRSKRMLELNMTSMKAILNYLIQWIIESDKTFQKLKINLYGSLAIFLQLISITEDNPDTHLDNSLYVSRLDSSKYRIQDEMTSIYISSNMLSSCDEKLIEVLCYDCTGSLEISKMLAMSCFSLLLSLSGNISWIVYMSARGYMKHILSSILKSDDELRAMLEPVPDHLKGLYFYDAKMSLLARIATVKVGADLLLEQNFPSILASMKVFDFHPQLSKHLQVEDIDEVMSVEHRYLKIWEPALHICNAILTSLGTENQAAIKQILCFLISHLDGVELVLRSGNPNLSQESLKELSMLTSIIARTANNDLIAMLDGNSGPQENRTHLFRIQKLMLALVPRFILTDSVLRDLLCDPDNEQATYQTSERLSYALEIIANLVLYSRNIIQNNGITHDSVGVIFQPNLNDALLSSLNGNYQNQKNYTEHPPSLGVIIQTLINTVNYFHKEKGTLNFLNRKVLEIPELGTVDLKDFVANQGFDITIMRVEAMELVNQKLNMKKHNIDHCLLIIEHAMYIIWAHLDYYMLKAIPKAKTFGLQISNKSMDLNTTLASATEAMWKVSTDDISNLKQGLVSIFNDSFCRQLVETTQGRSESDIGFIEVLLRKTKRLIQFVPVK